MSSGARTLSVWSKGKMNLTQALRDEHQELLPYVENLRTVADALGEMPLAELKCELDTIFAFLEFHLIPHAHAENDAVYPVVARYLGNPQATATMTRDHVEIAQLAEEIGLLRMQIAGDRPLEAATVTSLRRLLYGLYTVLKLHFAKEEEIYLPLLDEHLTPHEARWMFEEMEAAVKHELRGPGALSH